MRSAALPCAAVDAVEDEAADGRDVPVDELDEEEVVRWCGRGAAALLAVEGVLEFVRPWPLEAGARPLLPGAADGPWVLLVRWRVLPELDEAELTEVDDPAASARTYGRWKEPAGAAPRQSPP